MPSSSDSDSFYSNPQNFFASLNPNIPQPTGFPSSREVKKEAYGRSQKIFSDWTSLHDILERYEELLRKRWMKKSQEQRKKLLLAAWPTMSVTHRPDFGALLRETPEQRMKGTKFKEAFMWPYINVEDVTKGKSMLLFLNSRGRHLPHVFAHADYDTAHIGETSGAIRSPFLNSYTMLLRGQTTPETYGQLVAWDEDDNAFDWLYSGLGFHPGHGLIVLEIQQKMLQFLVTCCFLILHDLSANSLTDKSVPIQAEPPPVSKDETEYPSLRAFAAEAPYKVPAHLDFVRLKAIVAAKRAGAEDHIWSLREDPGYFYDIVGDWSEHRQEIMLDTNGKRHPALKEPLFWDRVLGNVVVNAYGTFLVWEEVYRQVAVLTVQAQKNSKLDFCKSSLPAAYEKALHNFRYLLDQASKGPIANLKMGFPASPPIRSLFVREPQQPGSTRIQVHTKSAMGKDELLLIFDSLCDDQKRFLCGLPDLLDEFERLTQENSKHKARISSWVANVFSDLAVIAQARHQLALYHPVLSMYNENDTEDIKSHYAKLFPELAELINKFEGVSLSRVGSIGEGRFNYPSEKRRTLQTIEAMRNAEHNLDEFWRTADEQMAKKSGKTLHQLVGHLLSGDRQIQRTPEWIEPTQDEIQVSKHQTQETLFRPFSYMQTDNDEHTQHATDSEEILPAKAKVKTRGVAFLSRSDASNEQIEAHQPDKQPKLIVSKRALKVFSVLFHSSAQSDTPGEIAWSDFLHAMVATGFAPEKLYGSVWQFTPTKLDVERSIQFHEPHPRKEIPFRTARRHGRRLNRAYGWTGDMFTLA